MIFTLKIWGVQSKNKFLRLHRILLLSQATCCYQCLYKFRINWSSFSLIFSSVANAFLLFSLKQRHRLRILHKIEHNFAQRWIPIRLGGGGEDARLEEFICNLTMSSQCTNVLVSLKKFSGCLLLRWTFLSVLISCRTTKDVNEKQ